MKVFVVNLEQSTDRRAFMDNQLSDLGIKFEFFPAVDGRLLSVAQMEKMCNMEVAQNWPTLFTPGMIGCSLSHYRVYQKMIEENIEFALILEDDTRLDNSLPQVLNHLERRLNEGQLSKDEPILLYFQSKDPVSFSLKDSVQLDKNSGVYYPVELWRPITTAAYIISLNCAQRLVKLIYPVRCPSDSWTLYYNEGAIGGIKCVLPLPVQSGFFSSDIGYDNNKKLNQIVKYFEKIGLFPIPQLLKWRRRQLAKKQNRFILTDEPVSWELRFIPSVS